MGSYISKRMDSYISKRKLTDMQRSYLEFDTVFEQLWTLCVNEPTTKEDLKLCLYQLRDWGLGKITLTDSDGAVVPYTKSAVEEVHVWMGDNLDSVLQFCLDQGLIVPYKEGDALEDWPRPELRMGGRRDAGK